MILFIGGFALGVVSGMALLHFTVIKNLEGSRNRWKILAEEALELNRTLLTNELTCKESVMTITYAEPVIETKEKPVFRSESEKGKKSAKVSRSNAGRVR